MRKIANDEELGQLHRAQEGFIYNDYSGPREKGALGNVLHEARCRSVAASNTKYPKYFFVSVGEAASWLVQNRGVEGVGWRRCQCCSGAAIDIGDASPVRTSPALTKRESGKATVGSIDDPEHPPFTEGIVEDHLEKWFTAQQFRVVKRVRVSNGVIDLVAYGPGTEWVIEAKGEDRGGFNTSEMNFRIGISQLLSRISGREGKEYGLAIPLSAKFRRVLARHQNFEVFERMGLWLFVVTRDGAVSRLAPSEVQAFCDSLGGPA